MSVDLEKNSRIAELLDIYGELLADKQKAYLHSYYHYDLSLSEIADEYKISRASVLDSLKQGTKKLEEFEEKLHILENKQKVETIINSDMNKDEIIKELERIL